MPRVLNVALIGAGRLLFLQTGAPRLLVPFVISYA